jgi:glycogen operon protein
MFAGQEKGKEPEVIYVASNSYWEEVAVLLPQLPQNMAWELTADTWEGRTKNTGSALSGNTFVIHPRSVMVWVGGKAFKAAT